MSMFMLAADGLRSPTRATLGTASLSISSLFVFSSAAKVESPVTLPPGRARLATRPSPTGSVEVVITMGMVLDAPFAANAGGGELTTIRSTLRRTRSAASSGRRSVFCSANRYSMVIFFPSIQPSLLSSCRNASTRTPIPEAVLLSRKPMRKIFPVCCASANVPMARRTSVTNQRSLLFMAFTLKRDRRQAGKELFQQIAFFSSRPPEFPQRAFTRRIHNFYNSVPDRSLAHFQYGSPAALRQQ